mgnify:FL=1
MLYSTIIGAIVNVVLNFILVFSLKHNGVAIASVITEFCVAIYQVIIVKKIIKISITKRFFISTLTGTLTMTGFVIICKFLISNLILSLIFSIIVGVVSYFIVTAIFKNEISVWIINGVKKIGLRFRKNSKYSK